MVDNLKNPHIKVDWETLQIIMKSRDMLGIPMAGLDLRKRGVGYMPAGRITKECEHSNPVLSEFHRILWCGIYMNRIFVA